MPLIIANTRQTQQTTIHDQLTNQHGFSPASQPTTCIEYVRIVLGHVLYDYVCVLRYVTFNNHHV